MTDTNDNQTTVGSVVFGPEWTKPTALPSYSVNFNSLPPGDTPLPEDAAIRAAHPLNSGRHDLYLEAMRLVGARHSKGGLVELVTWLLLKAEAVNGRR